MACTCNSAMRGGDTVLRGVGSIRVAGSGTATDPYIITETTSASPLTFTVNDSTTVNLQLTGSGTSGDPYVLRADTASASNLRGLGDVAATPVVTQGAVPLWIGTTAGGHFEMRTPGTRYTTNATRGLGLYQGEIIRETDTQRRYEWDGTQWLSLDVTIPSFSLDPSVVQNAGSVTSTTDWNTLNSKSGIYRVGDGVTSSNNAPTGAYGYGTLEVLLSGNSVTQNYYAHSTGLMYTRTKWNVSDWTAWQTQVTTGTMAAALASSQTTITNAYTAAINSAITTEANTRQSIDGGLQNDYIARIGTEASARLNQDNAIIDDYRNRDASILTSIDGGRLDTRYPLKGTHARAINAGTGVINTFNFDATTGNWVGNATVTIANVNSVYPVAGALSIDSGGVTAMVNNVGSNYFQITMTRRNNAATGYYWIAASD